MKYELVQVSKEFVNGKWVKVGFYENEKGDLKLKIMDKATIPTKQKNTKDNKHCKCGAYLG